jgi:hypothetical protein
MSDEKFFHILKMLIPIVVILIVLIYGMSLTQTPEGQAAGQTPGGFLVFFAGIAFIFFCTPIGWIVGIALIIGAIGWYINLAEMGK